jgi:hypothetical protein
MSNEQNNQENKEITIIIEEGNDNAEYLKNRKNTKGDYSKNTVEEKDTSNEYESDLLQKLESVTIMSVISVIFYICSALSIIGMFGYLSEFKILKDIEIMSVQFMIICSFLGTSFTFFSFGKLFEVVNRIYKNTKK